MKKWRLLTGIVLASMLALPSFNAYAEQVYKFGLVAAFTGGPAAAYGVAVRRGAELALNEINAKGGIKGHRLEAIMVDDQANPTLTVSTVHRFISVDKVPIIFGSFTSVSLAAIPVVSKAKVVWITPLVTHPGVIHKSRWAFSVSINLAQTSAYVAEFAYRRGARRPGLVVFNNESTRRMGEAVKKKFKSLGGKVVAEEIMPRGADFRSTLLKLKAARPDALIIASFVGPEALLIKQMAELGWKVPTYSANPVEEEVFFKTVGDAAEGLLYGSLLSNPKKYENFRQRFKQRYKEEPGTFGAQGYETAYVIAEAIKRGGYTSQGIRNALAGLKNFNGVLGTWSFDDGGFSDLPITMKVIKGKRFEFYKR
ncbi:MAG: ABC transporter substrate-binding protein [Thermodesulfobacteriota bacterium]